MASLVHSVSNLDQDYFDEILKKNKVPGVAVGVYDQHNLYFRTAGEREKNAPIDEQTSFRIASLTKPVFAYLVLSAVYDGVLDLDTPLVEYFGRRYVDDDRMDILTTRHVLSHQTGWPNWSWDKPLEFEFSPGEKWQYCGEGYVYLQHILRKLYDEEVFMLMGRKIYGPLNMRYSSLIGELLNNPNKSQAHDENGLFKEQKNLVKPEMVHYINRMSRWGNVAGSMWTSIWDYTRFLRHLMYNNSTRVCKIRDWMFSEQVKVDKDRLSWGLGIGLDNINNSKVAWHWGSDEGFKSFTVNWINEGLGISVFTNGENGQAVYSSILDEILDEIPTFIEKNRK